MKNFRRSDLLLLVVVSALVYLPFIARFGYYNDDWYLMYAAGARGAVVFREIFSVDRPLRALVMAPAYLLFGANPIYYDLSAYIFRVLSAFGLLWLARLLWPGQRTAGMLVSLLFLIYPGFMSQFNGIDYQSQMVSLAAAMFSLALTIKALQSTKWAAKIVLFGVSALLTWLYLGLVEYFIGVEAIRLACILLLAAREVKPWPQRFLQILRQWIPSLIALLPFLIWRLFFFESERGATDVNLQLGGLLASPSAILIQWSFTLLKDALSVLLLAWQVPLYNLGFGLTGWDFLAGFGIAAIVAGLVWVGVRGEEKAEEAGAAEGSNWRREAFWLAITAILFGLLPVILVGRSVDFHGFSRYTLIASMGTALLWVLGLQAVSDPRLRNVLLCLLVVSAALTHFANGLKHVRDTEATRNFWWQASWRIPQLEIGTTLVTRYSVVAEEDYFVWGPANLIYYPESTNEQYVQPGVYAAILNEETILKVLTRERQEFDNRRSIRTYKNYRNILILTQPTSDSCVQVIDGNHLELSSSENARVTAIAPYSESERIFFEEPFHIPPAIPFGPEPPRTWCYYYEKASLARQMDDWETVSRLGDEAFSLGYFAKDMVEWMPFVQAYARLDDTARLTELASFVTSDPFAAQQACQSLRALPLAPSTQEQVEQLFCLESK